MHRINFHSDKCCDSLKRNSRKKSRTCDHHADECLKKDEEEKAFSSVAVIKKREEEEAKGVERNSL